MIIINRSTHSLYNINCIVWTQAMYTKHNKHSASEVTTLRRYTNLFIIIIIITIIIKISFLNICQMFFLNWLLSWPNDIRCSNGVRLLTRMSEVVNQWRDLWVSRGSTSHSTLYRSFRWRFLQVRWPNIQRQSTEESQLVTEIGFSQSVPLHRVTI